MDEFRSLMKRAEALAGVASVDPAALSGDAALSWVKSIAQVIRAGEALLAPFAVRLEELSEGPSRYARWKNFPSAAALIAHEAGISQSQAHALVSLGRVMTREVPVVADPVPLDFGELECQPDAGSPLLPGVGSGPLPDAGSAPARPSPSPVAPVRELSPLAKAARDRTLGTEAIRVIATTLDDMRIDTAEVEALLVAKARKMKIREVRRLCLAVFAEWDPEGYAARQAAQRERRELIFFPRRDGMVGITGALDAEAAGRILPWFEAEASAAQRGQRKLPEDQQRTLGQINVDTLVALASHAEGCEHATSRPKTTLVVRVTEEALRTGVGMATCDGLEGPISMQTLRRMAVDAEVIPVVMGGRSLALDVGRATRYATPAIRLALGERDKGCAMCSRSLAWCDAHHIEFWSRGGRTSARNMVMLCVGCHHRVHDCGWIVEVDEQDNVSFIPPATVDPHRRRQPASSARFAA